MKHMCLYEQRQIQAMVCIHQNSQEKQQEIEE
jgi:hypothetical protein